MFDKIKSILRHDRQQEEKVEVPKTLVQQIVEAPALFNRRTRRSIGLFGRFWKWDLNASEETRRPFLPRYIRRHFTTEPPHTRRQRKARARVLRIVQRTHVGGRA